jgi:hypothetical protein
VPVKYCISLVVRVWRKHNKAVLMISTCRSVNNCPPGSGSVILLLRVRIGVLCDYLSFQGSGTIQYYQWSLVVRVWKEHKKNIV